MHISNRHIEILAFVSIQDLASLLFNDTMSTDSRVDPCKKVTTSMGKYAFQIQFLLNKMFVFYIGFDTICP